MASVDIHGVRTCHAFPAVAAICGLLVVIWCQPVVPQPFTTSEPLSTRGNPFDLVAEDSRNGQPLAGNSKNRKVPTGHDHHPFSFSMLLAGGGVKGGYVHGKTDEIGWGDVEDPVHVNDFHATPLHLLGLDPLQLICKFQGHDFRFTDVDGNVLQKLLA